MSKDRVVYYDVLNVVAGFGVVAMHFNGLAHAYSPTPDWVQALFVDCLFFWAVPVFLMLSGATLMDYRDRYDTKTFMRRRVSRALVPFVAWSLIALVWKVATGQMEPPVGPRSLVGLVFNARIIDIYWFFVPLVCVYLCLPVLSLLREHRRALWYVVVMGAALNCTGPVLFRAAGVAWNAYAQFPLAGNLLIYPILGYLLRDAQLGRRRRALLYGLGAAGLLARFVSTILASRAAGATVDLLGDYSTLTCLLEATAVFVFARQVRWERLLRTPRARSRLASVAGCTLGIYLTHMFVFWYGLELTPFDGLDVEWRLVGPFLAYAICLAFVMAARRVPFVRRLFP